MHRSTRRELIALGLGAAVAADTGIFATPAAGATTPSDTQLLQPLIGAETLCAFAYHEALVSGFLSPAHERAVRHMAAQEQEHVRALTGILLSLGGTPPPPVNNVADADRVLAAVQIPGRLESLVDERDAITVLVRIEWLLQSYYYHSMPKLSDPGTIQLCAQLMATDAQHSTVLNDLLRPGEVDYSVPVSFVEGPP